MAIEVDEDRAQDLWHNLQLMGIVEGGGGDDNSGMRAPTRRSLLEAGGVAGQAGCRGSEGPMGTSIPMLCDHWGEGGCLHWHADQQQGCLQKAGGPKAAGAHAQGLQAAGEQGLQACTQGLQAAGEQGPQACTQGLQADGPQAARECTRDCVPAPRAVHVLCGDYAQLCMQLPPQDVVFLDPPWGGPQYTARCAEEAKGTRGAEACIHSAGGGGSQQRQQSREPGGQIEEEGEEGEGNTREWTCQEGLLVGERELGQGQPIHLCLGGMDLADLCGQILGSGHTRVVGVRLPASAAPHQSRMLLRGASAAARAMCAAAMHGASAAAAAGAAGNTAAEAGRCAGDAAAAQQRGCRVWGMQARFGRSLLVALVRLPLAPAPNSKRQVHEGAGQLLVSIPAPVYMCVCTMCLELGVIRLLPKHAQVTSWFKSRLLGFRADLSCLQGSRLFWLMCWI